MNRRDFQAQMLIDVAEAERDALRERWRQESARARRTFAIWFVVCWGGAAALILVTS